MTDFTTGVSPQVEELKVKPPQRGKITQSATGKVGGDDPTVPFLEASLPLICGVCLGQDKLYSLLLGKDRFGRRSLMRGFRGRALVPGPEWLGSLKRSISLKGRLLSFYGNGSVRRLLARVAIAGKLEKAKG